MGENFIWLLGMISIHPPSQHVPAHHCRISWRKAQSQDTPGNYETEAVFQSIGIIFIHANGMREQVSEIFLPLKFFSHLSLSEIARVVVSKLLSGFADAIPLCCFVRLEVTR